MIFMKRDWSTMKRLMFLQQATGGGAGTEYEATGNPAVFETNMAKALTQFLIPFTPVQSGSGDPSPSNVRAISGWTGVKAYRTGANIISSEFLSNYANYTVQGSYGYYYTEYMYLPAGTSVSFTWINANPDALTSECNLVVVNGTQNKYIVNGTYKYTNQIFTVNADGKIRFGFYKNTYATAQGALDAVFGNADLQVEFSNSTATAYTPYSGNSHSVTFPNTVYGGTLDLATGVLTATHKQLTLDGETEGIKFSQFVNGSAVLPLANGNLMGRTTSGWITVSAAEQNYFISNIFPTGAPDGSGRRVAAQVNASIQLQGRFYFDSADEVSDLTTANAFLKDAYDGGTPVKLLYPLSTPTTYPITPQQINTLIGDNTVWSDTNGTNTIKYLKKG